jgi:hypothetical protein
MKKEQPMNDEKPMGQVIQIDEARQSAPLFFIAAQYDSI